MILIAFLALLAAALALLSTQSAALDLNKQRKLTRAARMFLLTNKIPATTRCRFDVVGINAVADDIDWVRDAFDAM